MSRSIDEDIAAVGVIDAVPKLLETVCRSTGMGFAAVARVTEDRWVALAVRDEIEFGLEPGGELEVVTTICDEIRDTGRAVVIDHVAEDAQWCGHPTPAMYGFQSYISVPIVFDGRFFGTLCAIDPKPAKLRGTPIQATFELFAELIGQHMAARARLAASQAELLDARQTAELREQFIAVLGHDLRNPLASIDSAARLVGRTVLESRAIPMVHSIHVTVGRMTRLLDDVLDFARGRLGGGIPMDLRPEPNIAAALGQVIDEVRLTHPDRRIDTEIVVERPVEADGMRLGQLLGKLLSNALTHGTAGEPVRVRAACSSGGLELAVINRGPPIPEDVRRRLFQPFARTGPGARGQGLGLGLYIAAEIAHAHGGELLETYEDGETTFTFRMPLAVPLAGRAEAAQA